MYMIKSSIKLFKNYLTQVNYIQEFKIYNILFLKETDKIKYMLYS